MLAAMWHFLDLRQISTDGQISPDDFLIEAAANMYSTILSAAPTWISNQLAG